MDVGEPPCDGVWDGDEGVTLITGGVLVKGTPLMIALDDIDWLCGGAELTGMLLKLRAFRICEFHDSVVVDETIVKSFSFQLPDVATARLALFGWWFSECMAPARGEEVVVSGDGQDVV